MVTYDNHYYVPAEGLSPAFLCHDTRAPVPPRPADRRSPGGTATDAAGDLERCAMTAAGAHVSKGHGRRPSGLERRLTVARPSKPGRAARNQDWPQGRASRQS